jgi:hypothetical protein
MKNAVRAGQSQTYQKYPNAKNTNTMVNAMTTKLATQRLAMFQYDLQHGMTISEALTKHNLTFKQAFQEFHGYQKKNQNRKNGNKQRIEKTTNEQYIYARDDRYYLRKCIKNESKFFGVYRTLEDAIKVRDYCIRYGWKQHSIDRYCEELGVERLKHKYKRRNRRYH